MKNIEFISYDGQYPNLCFGTLVYKVNGTAYSKRVHLSSGGSVGFTPEWNAIVKSEEWKSIINWEDLPGIDSLNDHDALLEEINDRVPYGCCGGCV